MKNWKKIQSIVRRNEMKLWIVIVLGLFWAFWTAKLKVNIVSLKKGKNLSSIEFDVKLGVYLFGFVKILGISLRRDGIHVLGFAFPYRKWKMKEERKEILKSVFQLDLLKSLNIQLEKWNLDLKIGTEEVGMTVFSVFFISTLISALLAKNGKQNTSQKYHYQIRPVYHKNMLEFDFSAQISMRILAGMRFFKVMNQHRKEKEQDTISRKKVPLKI